MKNIYLKKKFLTKFGFAACLYFHGTGKILGFIYKNKILYIYIKLMTIFKK